MFTGLIETTGKVLDVEVRHGARRITVAAPGLAAKLRTGDSVAVSGVCLTALDIQPETVPPVFHADLAAETVARTSLAALAPGSTVNLELPTAAGSPLGGHIVQGHVDGTGKLLSLAPVVQGADPSLADWWLRVAVPQNVSRYMIEKGSVAVEGISLTIARYEPGSPEGDVVSIAIIPHTYQATNLHTLSPGALVNVEADVLVKFAEQQSRKQEGFDLTLEYLMSNGY
jgi:riboflavin synthase